MALTRSTAFLLLHVLHRQNFLLADLAGDQRVTSFGTPLLWDAWQSSHETCVVKEV